MITLDTLKDSSRSRKKRKRVGRGPGSKVGKTCGRGEKGAGARAGYKTRLGYEGGQMRLHMKIPKRGFSNVRFKKRFAVVNLLQIDAFYSDGEEVNFESLFGRGLIGTKMTDGIKILGEGEITKKVTFNVDAFSASAKAKLQEAKSLG